MTTFRGSASPKSHGPKGAPVEGLALKTLPTTPGPRDHNREDETPLIGSGIAPSYSSRAESFFRTVGLQTLHNLWLQIRGRPAREKKRIAVQKDIQAASLATLIHLIPVLASLSLAVLNGRGLYIGGELAGPTGQDPVKFLLLQFAAKLHELTMLASLSAIVLSIMRRELIVGHGLPFGSISIGLSITNISVLWSKEFLGTCLARFNSLRKKWFLLVMIVVCAILGVTVGPASATAMKPQLDDWKAGGTSLWLNTTIDQLWPQQLNSTYILDGACQTAGSNDACPSTGWDAFGEGYATFWPGLEVEPGVWRALPRYVRVPAKDSVLELQVGASDQNLYSISPTMTTMPQAVIADAISASGELWPVAAWTVTQLGKTRFQYRQSSTYNIGAIQPATRIKCNVTYGRDTPSFPLWGDDTLVPYTSDPLQESIKNELNRTDLALNWIELPGDQFESSSIGVVVTIPVGRGGLDLIACNVDARWMNLTTTSGTEIGPRMVASSLNVYNSTLDWGNSSKRVIIGPDWAQYLNPIDPTTNKSTFNTLAAEAGIGTNQPITVATPVIVESLLALMITNGLSRVGYNSTIQGDLKPELVWEEQFLPASGKVFGYGQHAYEIDPELRKGYMPLQLTVTVRGYAYGTNGAAIITSLVVLLTYSALAIAHSIWIICFSRMSSNSWETISEVTALAMNSPPTSALRNTCAGISTIQTFSQRVRILAVSDHLEMAFVDHDDSEIGGTAVEPNRYYGNKQDLETSDLRRSRLKCT